VDATNSRKKSPRSSRKSETQTTSVGGTPPRSTEHLADDPYDERSNDLVARVRAAREAAQHRMDAFGDPADYVVRTIVPSPAHAAGERVSPVRASSPTDPRQQAFRFEALASAANGFDPKGKE
jgi:hypothetical protein